MELDDLWITIKIDLIVKDGDIYRYHYIFDAMEYDDGGIIESEKDVLKEIDINCSWMQFFHMFEDRKIDIIKAVSDERFIDDEGIDFSSIFAVKYIRQRFLEDGIMPERIELLNFKTFEKLKDHFPEEYDEIMNMIDLDIKNSIS